MVYGLATVLPRMFSFLLVPLYTHLLDVNQYGKVSVIFSYFVIFNVILAYGMETAFFRFFNKEKTPSKVVGTSAISLICTSFLFAILAFLIKGIIADFTGIEKVHINLVIGILLMDALVIIPFAWMRAREKSWHYSVLKISNVAINLSLNLFFLIGLPKLVAYTPYFNKIYFENYEITYIFISNFIASTCTLLFLVPFYFKISFQFDKDLWIRMIRYALPVLIAGIGFSINESFDRILLERLLPENESIYAVGVYAACYKMAVFMTLFATAFRLGIEPFFFSHADDKNAPLTYAKITNFFVAIGSLIFLIIIVFINVFKKIIILNSSYWEALHIVPFILLANLFLGIYYNLSVWYKITDKTSYGAYFSIIGAFITLVCNFIFIPYLGYLASAITTLVTYLTMMLLSWFYGRKFYPIPYDLRKIGLYLMMSIIFGGLSFYVFESNYIFSIPLLVLFIGIIYFKERKVIQVLIS